MSCVYKHTFPDGSVYIGKTDMEPEARWANGWGYKSSPAMFNSIIKHGWDNVQHEILYDNLTHDEALELEKKTIEEYAFKVEVLHNAQHIPPQYLAQESAHYVPAQSPPQKPTLPHRDCTERKHYKQHIIPITEKPDGVHTWPIDVYTKDGKYITTYPCAKVAAQELNVNMGDISSCCKGVKADGKPRYQCKGYIFRYAQIKKEAMV